MQLINSADAGIGKSRLVETFAGRARERDAIVFSGACHDLAEGAAPYAPFVAALRPLADELRGDEHAPDLGKGRRELAGLLTSGSYRSVEAARDHPLHGTVLERERSGHAERIELTGLSGDEVTAQITGILGPEPATRQTRSLFDRSEGNPFFVEELLAAGPTGTELTASLRDVLLTRVERLAPATRTVLRAVATIGRGGDEDLIGTVTGLPPGELELALREAVAHRLLVVSGDECDTRHALLREALHADLLPGQRNRLHSAVAEALEGKDVPAESARHWYAAGGRPRALGGFVAAAAAAQTTDAWAIALAHYERALRQWPEVSDAEVRCGLSHSEQMRRAAEAAMAEGAPDRAVELTEAA